MIEIHAYLPNGEVFDLF